MAMLLKNVNNYASYATYTLYREAYLARRTKSSNVFEVSSGILP
jgi:hypothetical protein